MPTEEVKPTPKRRPRGSHSTPRKTSAASSASAASATEKNATQNAQNLVLSTEEQEATSVPAEASAEETTSPASPTIRKPRKTRTIRDTSPATEQEISLQEPSAKTRVNAIPAASEEENNTDSGDNSEIGNTPDASKPSQNTRVILEEANSDGSVSEMTLGEEPRGMIADSGNKPVKYAIRPKKKGPNGEVIDEEENLPEGAEQKIKTQLPEPDHSPIKVQPLTLGQRVELDDNTTIYGNALGRAVEEEGGVVLKNTQKDKDMKNYASLMKTVGEMSKEIEDLTEKVETISNELAARIKRISELESDLVTARAAIEKVYLPATRVVLKKRRYRRKLSDDLLSDVLLALSSPDPVSIGKKHEHD